MSNTMLSLPISLAIPPRTLFSLPHGALAVQPCRVTEPAIGGTPVSPAAPLLARPRDAAPAAAPSARCSVKACVFPATSSGSQVCRYHELQQSDSEAELFRSHQPSRLLALYAPFGIAEDQTEDCHREDQRRQAAERERFLLDEPM